MPFAFFQRLTRRQQAIYLKSDAVTEMPLARPETLRPLVGELAAALESGERAPTESSTQCLASGLARALDLPPVQAGAGGASQARRGELHGLYETTGPGAARRASRCGCVPPGKSAWLPSAPSCGPCCTRSVIISTTRC